MTDSIAKMTNGVFPIMVGGALHGHQGEYAARPDGGLESMKECGCTLTNFVLPADLPQCRALGLQAIVLQDTFSWHKTRGPDQFFSEEELTRRAGMLVEACRSYKDAVFAYYIFDEPNIGQFPYIRSILNAIRRFDPATPCFVNLYPNHATTKQFGVDDDAPDPYGEYLERYCDAVRPAHFIRYDNFTVSHVHGQDAEQDAAKLRSYFSNLLKVRELAHARGLAAWNTGSCCRIRPHAAAPTPASLAFQAYTTLAAGYKGMGWYSYYKSAVPNPDGQYLYDQAPIDVPGGHKRTATFEMLREVNRVLRVYGDLLLPMTSVGVFFRDAERVRVQEMSTAAGEVVRDAHTAERQPLMIGEFRDLNGNFWFMAVNLDLFRPASVRLRLRDGFAGLDCVDPDSGRCEAADPARPIELRPGSGLLYRAHKTS
jgi:hypothetical protein